ncbi:hypothetical protein Emed_005391 [Eimeria media]
MEHHPSPVESPDTSARIDAVANSVIELRDAFNRNQQDMSAILRLSAERSPPRPMEVKQQPLDLFTQIRNGSYRTQSSNESPRTWADWSQRCQPRGLYGSGHGSRCQCYKPVGALRRHVSCLPFGAARRSLPLQRLGVLRPQADVAHS